MSFHLSELEPSKHSVNFLPMMIVFMSYDKLQASIYVCLVCSQDLGLALTKYTEGKAPGREDKR